MKIIDLRPDRALLKPSFDGYKLSLEPIPIIKQELTSKPEKLRPSDNQFSVLHAQLFGLQNHLVKDPWISGSSYYIDTNLMVQKVQYDESTGRLKPVTSVFKIPRSRARQDGDYNLCLHFISEKYCVISDGVNEVRIIDTGDRQRNVEWKANHHEELDFDGFLIQDARFEIINGIKEVHIVLIHVKHTENAFETILNWIQIVQKTDGEWELKSRKTLRGKGYPYYCALESKSNGLIVSSNKPFKLVFDSENPVEEVAEKVLVPKCSFSWTQSDEDINIKFDPVEGEIVVKNDKKLLITCGEVVVLDSDKFFNPIDSDLTTWTKDGGILQITMFKANGNFWPFLFPGSPDETTEMVRDVDMDKSQPSAVSNLASDLEECDFGLEGQEEEFTIERIDAKTHQVTHKIYLGSNPPLFNVSLRPGNPPAIVLRNDVDACLWLQNIPTSGEWTLKHDGTLNAFGYVQASKLQKKFMSCSPDTNYAIICESERHVFIYKGNYNTASGLRNRNGPQVSIGQQKLVTLEGSGEVIGISVENDVTILLTENYIICLQLCIEE